MLHVSVVIPAWNESRGIRQAVEAAWRAGAWEVIVADGGSTDDTPRQVVAAGGRLVRSALGRAVQQNAAAGMARGDVLLFQHADSWLDQRAMGQIQAALANSPHRWGGAFRQRIAAERFVYRLLERGNAARVRWRGIPFGDQGIFIRRGTFQRMGGFPEVPLMEDLIFSRRLRQLAWPLLLPGPIHVSARRWEQYGVVRQTLRNWSLQLAWQCGVSPNRLARFYPRHVPPADAEVPRGE